MVESLYNEIGSTTPDNLIAGNKVSILLKGVTIATGQGTLLRGSVIGIVSASGKGLLCDSASADGSENADCILADDVDTSSEDVVAQCYISGEFNRDALTFGGTDEADDHEDLLRTKGIFLKDNISY